MAQQERKLVVCVMHESTRPQAVGKWVAGQREDGGSTSTLNMTGQETHTHTHSRQTAMWCFHCRYTLFFFLACVSIRIPVDIKSKRHVNELQDDAQPDTNCGCVCCFGKVMLHIQMLLDSIKPSAYGGKEQAVATSLGLVEHLQTQSTGRWQQGGTRVQTNTCAMFPFGNRSWIQTISLMGA